MLSTTDHSRDVAGMTYVYPVISRRSGGLSIGINLNPNNACNWRCIYCQVPDLVRGSAPEIDLDQLESELRQLLHEIADGSFQQRFDVKADMSSIRDIAISGNGESTTAREFGPVMECIGKVFLDFHLQKNARMVLITNGSLIHKQNIQAGLRRLHELDGEVWFKLDSVTNAGLQRINNAAISIDRLRENLVLSASLCSTRIQSCFFKYKNRPPDPADIQLYLEFIEELVQAGVCIKGIQLYGIERESRQPEAPDLMKIEDDWFTDLAQRLQGLDLTVEVNH